MEATGTEAAKKKKVVIVMGSTGVGKSQLAIDLALALAKQEGHAAGAEVINADSMQVYRGFPIATAKGTTPTLHFLTKYLYKGSYMFIFYFKILVRIINNIKLN
jgi:tRNA A37 N6-isopentenylltransferase MiaA